MDIINIAKKEYEVLEKQRKILEKQLSKSPDGFLTSKRNRNSFSYFYHDDKSRRRLSTKYDADLIKQLAEKMYAQHSLDDINRRIKLLAPLLKKYGKLAPGQSYLASSEGVRKMLGLVLAENNFCPYQSGEAGYEWANADYPSHPCPPTDDLVSLDGHSVRSKSEMNICDSLFQLKIPYRYEAEFISSDGKKWYPDYTFQNFQSGEIVLWEHFGQIDDEVYAVKLGKKLYSYAISGYSPGNGLIVTFETLAHPLSSSTVMETIMRELCR